MCSLNLLHWCWLSDRARSLSPNRSGRSKILSSRADLSTSACAVVLYASVSLASPCALVTLSVDTALLTFCSLAPALRSASGMLSLKQLCFTSFKPVHRLHFVSFCYAAPLFETLCKLINTVLEGRVCARPWPFTFYQTTLNLYCAWRATRREM